jgi:ADP-heptose:LPS heptosyltransferase
LVEPLKARFPDAEWSIFCKDYAADIARCFPVKAKVVAADPWWDGSPGRGKGKMAPFLKAIFELRRFRADVIIVASTNWRAAASAWAIGAKKIIGFDRKKSRKFLTDVVTPSDWESTRVTKQLFRLLAPLNINGLADVAPPCRLDAPSVPGSLEKILLERRYVVLHPFAGDLRRCWPLSKWRQLAEEVRRKNLRVFWMGRGDEIHRIKEQVPEWQDDLFFEDFAKGHLLTSLGITSRAICLIGHDSGPIHMASALGVPIVGLYLPSEYPRTVTALLPESKLFHRLRPDDLSFEEVKIAVNDLIRELSAHNE